MVASRYHNHDILIRQVEHVPEEQTPGGWDFDQVRPLIKDLDRGCGEGDHGFRLAAVRDDVVQGLGEGPRDVAEFERGLHDDEAGVFGHTVACTGGLGGDAGTVPAPLVVRLGFGDAGGVMPVLWPGGVRHSREILTLGHDL